MNRANRGVSPYFGAVMFDKFALRLEAKGLIPGIRQTPAEQQAALVKEIAVYVASKTPNASPQNPVKRHPFETEAKKS
jgi:hypothetical protein